MRRCGEIDFLMGRLKDALQRKVEKKEVLSPYNCWLERQMEQHREERKELNEQLKEIVERAKREKREKKRNKRIEKRG